MMAVVTGTLSINSGATWTTTASVTLSLSASSTGGAVTQMRFSNDGTTFSAFEPFAATKAWTLDAAAGAKTVTVEFQDATAAKGLASDGIGLDPTAPTIPSLTINGGATVTRNLTLAMTTSASDPGGSGVSTVQFSNDQLAWTSPQAWAATVNLSVPAGEGSRVFYARVRDVAGNLSVSPYPTATILIDQTAPVAGTVLVNSGAAATNAPGVTLAISASDSGSGLARMCIKSGTVPITFTVPAAADSCWVPFATSANHTLTTSGNGNHRVAIWFDDVAGNITPFAATDDIVLDTVAPANGSVTVNNSAAGTKTLDVTLTIAGSDVTTTVTQLCVKSGTMTVTFSAPGAADPCWIPYATTLPYTMSSTAEGNHRVFVWFRDAVGNINVTPALDDIFLDTQLPTAPSGLTLVSIIARTVRLSMTLGTDPAPAAPPLRVQIGYRINGSSGPFTFALSTNTGTPGQVTVNLSLGNSYELVARMVDGAGNVSANSSNTVVATTSFAWINIFHTPWANPFFPTAADVLNGTHFVMSDSQGGAWIDDADGFATMRRLDSSGNILAAVPSTSRAMMLGSFTQDMGVTFWPLNISSAGTTFNDATWVGTASNAGLTLDTFVMVGTNGVIVRGNVTTTPGLVPTGSLAQVTSGTTGTLNAVATCLGCTGVVVAVGTGGIFRSTTGGATWGPATLPVGVTGTIEDIVSVPGTQTLYAAGFSTLGLLRSTDGGATWLQVSGLPINIQALSVGGSGASYTLWIASGLSTNPVLTKYDGTTATNVSLAAVPAPRYGPSAIASIGFGPTAQALYGGYSGELVHVSQNGSTVVRRMRGTPASLRGVAFADGSTQKEIIVGGSTLAQLTNDQGQTWSAEVVPGSPVSVYYFADGSAVAVGGTLILARSALGVWTTIPSGVTQNLTHVSCRGTGGCLISGANNTVLGYDPLTQVVTPLVTGPGNNYLGSYTWVDSGLVVRGLVVGANGAVRTCTGCLTASTFTPEILLPPPSGVTTLPTLRAVAARPNGRVVAVGDPGSFSVAYISSDSGVNWTRVNNPGGFNLKTVVNVPGTSTWYAAGYFGVARSTDDGAAWSSVTPTTWTDAFGLATPSVGSVPATLLMVGEYGSVWRSTTGGQ